MADQTVSTTVTDESVAPSLHGCPVEERLGQTVVFVTAAGYLALMKHLVDDGYVLCHDITAVDYLSHPGRTLPDGMQPERFEVVVSLQSLRPPARIRIRAQVAGDNPVVPTLFDLWPGSEAMEREVYDMFGIRFDGHPDLTRILMPEDWDGHPLRKDYDIGRIPVQFKGAPEAR
jgi:NADH-quinone oxidoreductase subunit C